MMELGNFLFNGGSDKGGWPVPRGVGYEEVLKRLFNAYAPKRDKSWRDYGDEFENGTFVVWPYSWCDCDCGFDEQDHQWSTKNHHSDACYQSLSKARLAAWESLHDYNEVSLASRCDIQTTEETKWGTCTTTSRSPKAEKAHSKWCKLYDKRRKFEDSIQRELCKELGIPWKNGLGAACHCTCNHDSAYEIWRESHNHHPICSVSRPNFLHKTSGFWMTWYKYPLRDAYALSKVTVAQFEEIIGACIASLAEDKGGKVLRLKGGAAA